MFLYASEKVGFNTSLSLFVFAFLLLGTSHRNLCASLDIFGGGILQVWALCSLFGTTLVLLNQIFLSMLGKFSTQVTLSLFNSYESLVPAFFMTVLATIVFQSLPLLACSAPRSVIHNILTYPRSLA